MTEQEIDALARKIAGLVGESLERYPPERLAYTVKDAAAVLGVKPSVIRDAISRGTLLARKRGRNWFIRRDYLIRWLTAVGH